MRAIRLALSAVLVLGLAACGSKQSTGSKQTIMPNVTGKRLDVAKSDIKRAGFADKVEVLGGGALGVIDAASWQVCDQLPAAGEVVTAAPRLTVDRSCGDSSSEPAPTESKAEETLTAQTSKDLAALLAVSDYCDDSVGNLRPSTGVGILSSTELSLTWRPPNIRWSMTS
jgi:PASTA domain